MAYRHTYKSRDLRGKIKLFSMFKLQYPTIDVNFLDVSKPLMLEISTSVYRL